MRDHRRLLARHIPEGPACTSPGTRAYQGAWQETIEAAESVQRAGPLHGLHRLRVDLEHRRQQPAPQRHLPRQRRQGQPGRAVHRRIRRSAATIRVDLWKWMAAYEEKTGGSVLAIAHNGNLSNGRMFPMIESFTGKPLDREYVETRAKWERLYEATQTKGDGEAHPFLSPERRVRRLRDAGTRAISTAASPKKKEMLEFEYARSALKNGLKLEQQLGTNPYKFGLIGSTDAHTGLAADGGGQLLRQDHAAGAEPRAPRPPLRRQPEDRREDHGLGGRRLRLRRRLGHREHARGASGTRCSARRPTPRPARAWSCASSAAGTSSRSRRARPRRRPRVGYTKGVPMGGDLRAAPAGKAPTFLVAALKDPIGANLDRIQIVKGWLDAKGELHEKVYDVAWSRRSQARRRTASCRRSGRHGRRRERDLDQHDRRARADRGLEGPGLRSRRSARSTTPA